MTPKIRKKQLRGSKGNYTASISIGTNTYLQVSAKTSDEALEHLRRAWATIPTAHRQRSQSKYWPLLVAASKS